MVGAQAPVSPVPHLTKEKVSKTKPLGLPIQGEVNILMFKLQTVQLWTQYGQISRILDIWTKENHY